MNGGPGLLAPAQSFCKPRQPFHTATAATTLQGALGVKALARPKGTSDGPLSLAIETSDLKMKVATLEGELEQQQESMQAMGEEPHHVALCHMPCAQWCSWISTLCLLSPGLLGQRERDHKDGPDWSHCWVGCHLPPREQLLFAQPTSGRVQSPILWLRTLRPRDRL